jgi:hypothetical protein
VTHIGAFADLDLGFHIREIAIDLPMWRSVAGLRCPACSNATTATYLTSVTVVSASFRRAKILPRSVARRLVISYARCAAEEQCIQTY